MMPSAMIRATASPACITSSNDAITTRALRGTGNSLTLASVTTASMPSEPIIAQAGRARRIERAGTELDDARRRS